MLRVPGRAQDPNTLDQRAGAVQRGDREADEGGEDLPQQGGGAPTGHGDVHRAERGVGQRDALPRYREASGVATRPERRARARASLSS